MKKVNFYKQNLILINMCANKFLLSDSSDNNYCKLISKLNEDKNYELSKMIYKETNFLEKIYFSYIKDIKNLIAHNIQEIEKYFDKFLFISSKDSKIIDKFEKITVKPLYKINFDCFKENDLYFSNLKNIEKKVDLILKENHKKNNILLVFSELTKFFDYYDFQLIENFFNSIKYKLYKNKFTMFFLIYENSNSMKESQQIKFNKIISSLIEFPYSNIMDLLSHTIRRNIIKLLMKKSSLNYNEIFHNIPLVRSSNLAYHINILLKENILSKNGRLYSLTQRGLYFCNLINLLDTLSLVDPGSSIKII
ncbi:MAG: hypothetical protein ACTSQO_07910 [Candidatus Helarchaeota archaeon]